MRHLLCCHLVVGLLLSAGAASAEELVPLVPKMDPVPAAERLIQFHDALAQGLKAGGADVMPAPSVRARLKLAVENAGCDEGPCLQTNASLVGSSRLATAKVSAVGKNYTFEVRIYRGSTQVARTSGRCDICNNAEAVQTLQRLATELGGKAEEPAAVTPPPVVEPKPGPKAAPAPKPEPPAVETKPVVDQPPGPAPKKRVWPLWPAILAASLGVVGIAVGAPLVAIDGSGTNCRGEPREDLRNCQDLYATAAGGWTLTGMGLGSLAASGVLFYLHFSSKPREQPRAATVDRFSFAPLPEGGVAFGAAGRF
jgi:hypothetical protein